MSNCYSDAGTPGSRGSSNRRRTHGPLSPLRRSPRLRMLYGVNYELGDNESCGNEQCTAREISTSSIPVPMEQVSATDVWSSRSSIPKELRPTSRECEGDVSEFGDRVSEREGVRQIADTFISWSTVITSLGIMLICAVNFAGTDSCSRKASISTLFIVAVVAATRRFIAYMLKKAK